MKKLLVLGILVLFVSAVFTLESDPSDVVGYVKYDLENNGTSGYNIVAVPLGTVMVDQCNVIYADIPNCDAFSKWDAAAQLWVTYDGMPWTPTFAIDSGYSYMSHVTANGGWYSSGALQAAPSFALINNGTSGYNMIMLPLDESALATCDLLYADIANCDALSKWDGTSQLWVTYDGMPWTPTWATGIGSGFMAHVTVNGTWPVIARDNGSKRPTNVRQ